MSEAGFQSSGAAAAERPAAEHAREALPGRAPKDPTSPAARYQTVVDERAGAAQELRQRLAIWRKASGAPSSRPRIPSASGALDGGTRATMEQQLGSPFGDVKIGTGADSADAAQALGARAFTVGNEVHFGAGQFAPGTKEGDRLIAHELTHAAQGRDQGVQRKTAEGGESAAGAHDVSEPHEAAEQEADAAADRAVDAIHGGGEHAAGESEHAAPTHQAAPVAAKRDGDWRAKMRLDGDKIYRATTKPAGAKKSAGKKAAAKTPDPNAPVATLEICADTETVDRTKLTIPELAEGNVGHAWIKLRYSDPKKVPKSIGAPTQALLKGAGTAMGFWPLKFRPEMFVAKVARKQGEMDTFRDTRRREKAGQTPGFGGTNNPEDTGYSLNPLKSYVAGRVEEPDDSHTAKGRMAYSLTQAQVDSLIEYVNSKRSAQYSLFFYNCTTFAMDATRAAGQAPPSGKLFGLVCMPNELYKGILADKLAGDKSAKTTKLGTVDGPDDKPVREQQTPPKQ